MGSPESCLHAEPNRLHGEKLAGQRGNRPAWLPGKIAIRIQGQSSEWKGVIMNKERLEWVMSGLSQYKLTENENQFIKSASGDFDQKQMLTERQEQRLENLYKEKSKSKPNKNSSDYFSFQESLPKKARVRKPFAKDVLITS
jgi:hypothetical protein